MMVALSVPWPTPVADSEPYRRTSTRRTRSNSPRSRSPWTNRAPARMGPTVWELEGPTPILNRSNTLMAITESPLAGLVCARHAHGGVAARLKQGRLELPASSGFYRPPRRLQPTPFCPAAPHRFYRGNGPDTPFSIGLVTQKCGRGVGKIHKRHRPYWIRPVPYWIRPYQ